MTAIDPRAFNYLNYLHSSDPILRQFAEEVRTLDQNLGSGTPGVLTEGEWLQTMPVGDWLRIPRLGYFASNYFDIYEQVLRPVEEYEKHVGDEAKCAEQKDKKEAKFDLKMESLCYSQESSKLRLLSQTRQFGSVNAFIAQLGGPSRLQFLDKIIAHARDQGLVLANNELRREDGSLVSPVISVEKGEVVIRFEGTNTIFRTSLEQPMEEILLAFDRQIPNTVSPTDRLSGLSSEIVKAEMAQFRRLIDFYYERAAQSAPGLSGKLVIDVNTDEKGNVIPGSLQVRVFDPSNQAAMAKVAADAQKLLEGSLKFPGGYSPTAIHYPIIFQ
ncbi:MAG: hypothetical protein Q7S98_02965 [Deltaproteobacteria bacterium]|nr:hypothetical protein [Deltaproteobacteria bacterium]